MKKLVYTLLFLLTIGLINKIDARSIENLDTVCHQVYKDTYARVLQAAQQSGSSGIQINFPFQPSPEQEAHEAALDAYNRCMYGDNYEFSPFFPILIPPTEPLILF